ncbi:MAG: YitT family protein [Rikenellaceae bacterium]
MSHHSNPKLILLKEYLLIIIGLIAYAFGFTALLIPAQTVTGGAGGISALIYYALGSPTTGFLTVGTLYFLVNAVLLSIGLMVIGPKFGIKTIFAIIFTTIMMNIFGAVLSEGLLGLSAAEGDQLLMVILGGVMCGFGVGICFTQGGSSGGTDIVAMMVTKYSSISFGRVLMMCDFTIILCSILVFKGDLKPSIYGFVSLAAIGYTVELITSGNKQSVHMFIFSSKYKVIGDRIINEAKRGVSYLEAEGGFTGQPQKITMVVCRKTQQSQIYRIIKEEDPQSFISTASVSGVYGEGFEALKVRQTAAQRNSAKGAKEVQK